jgi:hypothetical protein
MLIAGHRSAHCTFRQYADADLTVPFRAGPRILARSQHGPINTSEAVDAVGFHHLSPCLSQNAALTMDKSSVKLSHPAQRRPQEIAPTPAFLRYHNGCVPPEGLQRDE